jgi:hypothetical protein
MSISNKEFLTSKIVNFKKFLLETYQKVIENNRRKTSSAEEELSSCENVIEDDNMQKYIDDFDKHSFEETVLYIRYNILPYYNNFDAYLDKIFKEYNIEKSIFTSENITKIKLYLTCFAEIINQ